jgi:hypothetical protein
MMSWVLLLFGLILSFAWFNNVLAFDAFDQMRLDSLKPDLKSCREVVAIGRKALRIAAIEVPQRHYEQKALKLQKVFHSHSRKVERVENLKINIFDDKIPSQDDCAPLTPTMFPAPTTTTTTTIKTTTPGNTKFEEDEVEEVESKNIKITSHPLFINSPHDPYKNLVDLYDGLLNEDQFCNGPKPSSIADLTDGQLGGYAASLATTHASFLCPFCHQIATHATQKILHPRRHGMADDERLIFNSVLAHIPDPETLCSAALPVCHGNYAKAAHNNTAGTDCLKCSLCSTLSITLLQKVFLNPPVLAHIRKSADEEIFKNICSEICRLENSTTGFNNKDQKACRSYLLKEFDWFSNILKTYLLPSSFCHKTLQYCDDPNQPPNILHCLKLLCPSLGFPLTFICPLIPDKPADAAKFLNIKPPKMEL